MARYFLTDGSGKHIGTGQTIRAATRNAMQWSQKNHGATAWIYRTSNGRTIGAIKWKTGSPIGV